MTMTTTELAAILAAHQRWLRGEKDGQRANLAGAHLAGAHLAGAHLARANLAGAHLAGADLAGANLRSANLGALRVLQLGPLGSRRDYLVVKRFADGTTEAMTGCFRGTVDELEAAVAKTHADHPQYRREYRAALAYVRAVWEVPE